MTSQERLQIEAYFTSVREQNEVIINIEEVEIQIFRNLYHLAKNIEEDIDVEIVEPKKRIRIFKKG